MPWRSGLTVAAPLTTWSLMPSLGYGVTGAAPNSRCSLVSFSQNTAAGSVPSGPGPASHSIGPTNGWSMPTADSPTACMVGLGASTSQDQVLRNHAVGSTCKVAGSGPALATCTAISRSSALALA